MRPTATRFSRATSTAFCQKDLLVFTLSVLVVSWTILPVESVVVVVTVCLPSLKLLVSRFEPVTGLPSTATFVVVPGMGVGKGVGVAVRVPKIGVGVGLELTGVVVGRGVGVLVTGVGVGVGD